MHLSILFSNKQSDNFISWKNSTSNILICLQYLFFIGYLQRKFLFSSSKSRLSFWLVHYTSFLDSKKLFPS